MEIKLFATLTAHSLKTLIASLFLLITFCHWRTSSITAKSFSLWLAVGAAYIGVTFAALYACLAEDIDGEAQKTLSMKWS
jgi:hypothetical protein